MNSIATHVEYLLRKHDCVVIPGLGAMLCNYAPAHFDVSDGSVLNPPGRSLAFNALLNESDGVLAASVARKDGITYEAATRRVACEVELLRQELSESGEFTFGRLGTFTTGDGGVPVFSANTIPSLNGFFYGLRPIAAIPLEQQADTRTPLDTTAVAEAVATAASRRRWQPLATGIAAALALAVTLAMFILHPIQVATPVQTASIAPVPATETSVAETAAAPAEAIIEHEPEVTAPVQQPEAETAAARQESVEIEKPVEVLKRFNEKDPYCVVVASFPSKDQAEAYIAQHASRRLGILEKDNKFRIYSATAPSYNAANEQKRMTGQNDAWVCRR